MRISLLAASLFAPIASLAQAQLPPIRDLGPVVATSAEVLGTTPSIRALSGGRVLVSDNTKKRLVLFDSTLKNGQVILDPNGAAGAGFPARGGALIAAKGDTTLFLDGIASSFLIIEPDGKLGRAIAVPKPGDVPLIGQPALYGNAMLDAKGRIVYRARPMPRLVNGVSVPPDSGAIVRADFETRMVDTIAWIRIPPNQPKTSQNQLPDGTMRMVATPPPFEIGDDWTVTPDGSVALIRGQDYHIDWISPTGEKRSTTKANWDWRRLSDEEKMRLVDTLKSLYAKADSELVAQFTASGRIGPGQPKVQIAIEPVPASEVPDYAPPFITRQTVVDQQGRIWIPERGSSPTRPASLVYDVIDAKGQIVDRVKVPAPWFILGFGTNGAVYLGGQAQPSLLHQLLGPSFMSGAPVQPLTKFARATLPPR